MKRFLAAALPTIAFSTMVFLPAVSHAAKCVVHFGRGDAVLTMDGEILTGYRYGGKSYAVKQISAKKYKVGTDAYLTINSINDGKVKGGFLLGGYGSPFTSEKCQ